MKVKKILINLLLAISSTFIPVYAMYTGFENPTALGFTAPAEFAQQESVWLAWPQFEPIAGRSNIPQVIDIIAAITPYEYVDLVVNGPEEETTARRYLTKVKIPMENVRFHHIRHTDFWMRDVGAVFIRNKNGQLAVVDLQFNSWGMGAVSKSFKQSSKIDSKIDQAMAKQLGIPAFRSFLVAEGGALEFNGNGTLITTESVILQPQRNPGITKHQAEIELKRMFGVKKIIWLKQGIKADDSVFNEPIQSEGGPAFSALATNGHTDEFVRWVNDDTILLAEVTQDEVDRAGPHSIAAETKKRLDASYAILSSSTNQDGKPIKIIRVPVAEEIYKILQTGDSTFDALTDMFRADPGHKGKPVLSHPPMRSATFVSATSYLNYLITNKLVLMPAYWQPGRSDVMRKKDEKAQAIIQAAFPDRKIVAIKNIEDINIGGGGIHCISQQMPVGKTNL